MRSARDAGNPTYEDALAVTLSRRAGLDVRVAPTQSTRLEPQEGPLEARGEADLVRDAILRRCIVRDKLGRLARAAEPISAQFWVRAAH